MILEQFQKYLNTSSKKSASLFGIDILNIGHIITKAYESYPQNGHPKNYYFEWEKGRKLNEYQLLYISHGEGFFESEGLPSRPVNAGNVILLFPGVWHTYKPKENTGWEEYWIGFKGNYADHLLKQTCFDPQNPIIRLGFNNEFLSLFSNMVKEIEQPNESENIMPSFLMIQLLGIVYVSALISKQQKTKKDDVLQQILQNIDENWNKKIDFVSLSNSFNVSYSWFRKAFKELLNISPNQYLIMLRIKNAEQLIFKTNLTIYDIAKKCGFDSEFYFSKIFKDKMGFNASDLRKRK